MGPVLKSYITNRVVIASWMLCVCINTCTYAFCTLHAPDEAQTAETAGVHWIQLVKMWRCGKACTNCFLPRGIVTELVEDQQWRRELSAVEGASPNMKLSYC